MGEKKKLFVELRNVSKSYEGTPLLKDISLKIPYDSYFCICGPTGSGKSTLLKLIAGLEKPDEGEIFINNKLVNEVAPEDRGIGMLFEHMTYALFPHLSIYENIIYGPRVRGDSSETVKKTAHEMLQLVLLSKRAQDYPAQMSGGMKQRVAFARALMTGAKLVLLDEPFAALDAKIRLNLREELMNMVKSIEDLTIIHVTQDVEEALMVSDYICVLFSGEILQIGTPAEIYTQPKNIQVCNFFSVSNFLEGIVEDIQKDYTLVKCQNMPIQISDLSYSANAPVVIAVRATDLTIETPGKQRINQLEGKVLRKQFILGFMRYEVEITTGKVIVVEQSYDKKKIFEPDERVALSFLPEQTIVFPHPGEPLEQLLTQ